ncbi:MAG: ATPase [Geobacteraceae bacterium]|nr:ATPase [Geobacteraceae bacterium]
MIVRMAKVEIVGPKELLMDVLALVRELGIFQLEPDLRGFVTAGEEARVRSLALDEKMVAERLYYEELRLRIDELLACLPPVAARESYLEPAALLDAVAAIVGKHAALYGELFRKREALRKEATELGRYSEFLTVLETLLKGVETTAGLDFIGVTIREREAITPLAEALARLTGGEFEIVTAEAADGTVIALIAVSGAMAERVRQALSDEHIPELAFPPPFRELPFPEKIRRLRERLAEIGRESAAIDAELEQFARRWSAIYRRVREWLAGELTLLRSTAYVHETGMCFFIHGWMPAAEVAGLGTRLTGRFAGRVVVEEKLIREEELEQVPVALKNSPYFRPFELFARLLPLPRYTSYDPTPFFGVFFPLFFGMMLGDAGHGAVLLAAALFLQQRFRERRMVRDAARILVISSLCAILFGFCYGEFFGEFGHQFGMRALVAERGTAIVPMLFFSVSVGVMHVLFGLILGVFAALKKRTGKEACFKLLTILVVLCLVVLAGSLALPAGKGLVKPVLITLAVAVPFLLFTGGLMAPLELVKTIGNIISYVRIMAIGLTSVFLATAANNLAGLTGNVVTGTIVAGLLHGLGIIVGVFSPTIQSLRLHYVEFFSKFMEHGGRRFEPLKK